MLHKLLKNIKILLFLMVFLSGQVGAAINGDAALSQKMPTMGSMVQTVFTNPASQTLFLMMVSVIVHELGHAGVTWMFDPSKVKEIHVFCKNLGSHDITLQKPLFSLGNLHICGTHPFKGYSRSDRFDEAYKNALVLAGAGLSVAAFCCSLLFAVTFYCHYCDTQNVSSAVAAGLKDIVSPFQCIVKAKNISSDTKRMLANTVIATVICLIGHAFYVFTPNAYFSGSLFKVAENGDGEKLWEGVFAGNQVAKTGMRIASVIGELGCSLYLLKKYLDAVKQI